MNLADRIRYGMLGDGDWRQLDDNHAYEIRTLEEDGVVIQQGVNYIHRRPDDGNWCYGWASLIGPGPNWRLISLDPLHLEPSLLCRTCGNHGFIRDGKWVPA